MGRNGGVRWNVPCLSQLSPSACLENLYPERVEVAWGPPGLLCLRLDSR